MPQRTRKLRSYSLTDEDVSRLTDIASVGSRNLSKTLSIIIEDTHKSMFQSAKDVHAEWERNVVPGLKLDLKWAQVRRAEALKAGDIDLETAALRCISLTEARLQAGPAGVKATPEETAAKRKIGLQLPSPAAMERRLAAAQS